MEAARLPPPHLLTLLTLLCAVPRRTWEGVPTAPETGPRLRPGRAHLRRVETHLSGEAPGLSKAQSRWLAKPGGQGTWATCQLCTHLGLGLLLTRVRAPVPRPGWAACEKAAARGLTSAFDPASLSC